jgi:hypothetical protein
VRLSVALAVQLAAPPDGTADGLHSPVTENEWSTGPTVSVVEALSATGSGPSHVTVTVSVIARSSSLAFSGAV